MSKVKVADVIAKLRDGPTVRRAVFALLIGAVGGVLFAWLDLPLAWMLGAMAATMVASLAGADIALPQAMRQPMIGIVGIALGSAFTHDRLADLVEWLPSLATLPIYVVCLGALILYYLRQVSGFDHKTAFFAAAPGGLSEMIILSDAVGGDMRNVALFHSARLVLIVFSIPLLASLVITIDADGVLDTRHNEFRPVELAVLLGIGALGWVVADRLGLPAASFMGPLLASSLTHISGLVVFSPPIFLIAVAQLVLGTSVGSRFSGIPLRLIARTLLLGGGGTLLMFTFTFLFAGALHAMTGYPFALILLALIPGGFPEMSLIALSMGMDPAFVVTHHGLRVLLIFVLALPIFSFLSRKGWFKNHWR